MNRTFRPGRLHWFAWCGLLASTLVMTILVVPGLPTAGEAKLQFPDVVDRVVNRSAVNVGPPQLVREFEHGWPLTFQRRALGYTRQPNHLVWRSLPPRAAATGMPLARTPLGGVTVVDHEIAWTAPMAWRLGESNLQEFYLWPAVVDGLALIGVVTLFTAGCQRWIRRRGAIWRWRLIDFAAAFTLAAIALATWRFYSAAHERDAMVVPLSTKHAQVVRSNRVQIVRRMDEWQYRGPEWLARMVGGRKPLRQLERVVYLSSIGYEIRGGVLAGPVETDWEEVGKLTALRRITIRHGTVSRDDFEFLVELPEFQELAWYDMPAEAALWLPRLPCVKTIDLLDCPLPPRTIRQLRAAMPNVEIRVRPKAKYFDPLASTAVRLRAWTRETPGGFALDKASAPLTPFARLLRIAGSDSVPRRRCPAS